MKLIVKKGTTSKIVQIFIADSSSTTGAGLPSLVYNSGSLTAYYRREDAGNAGGTAITLATATLGTFSSGGFKEVDSTNMPGWYELHIPNAVLASGASWATIMLKGATNMAPVLIEIQLVAYDPDDSVHLGLTALPNAAAAASGGLIIQGSTNAAGVNQGITVFGGVLRYNSTSHIVDVFIADSRYTDGRGLTGLAYNTPSLVAYYSNEVQGNAGATAISLVTATLGTFSSGGFKEKDSANQPGVYELHLPNAAISSSVNRHLVVTLSGAANMATTRVIFTQVAMGIDNLTTPANVTQWSSTNVASPDTAGYPKVTLKGGTGAGELSLSSGVAQADIAKCGGSTVAAGAIPNVAAGSTGGLILIGTGTRDINPNAGGVVITATGMQSIFDLLTSAQTTSGSIGKLLVDNLNATISSRAATGAAMTLTSAYDAAKTAAQPGDNMGVANGSISDASFTLPTIGANTLATGPLGMIMQSWRTDHYKETFDPATGDLKRFASNGSTVLLVLPCSDTGILQTRGAAS